MNVVFCGGVTGQETPQCLVLAVRKGSGGAENFPAFILCTFGASFPSFANGKLHSLGSIGMQVLA
jgi:hypothetical protein